MNLVLHQLRTDVRARRFWLGASVVASFLAPLAAAWSMLAFPPGASNLFVAALCLAVLANAVFVAVAPMDDFPFSGSAALWRTRPMPQGAMFAARSLWIGGVVLLPLALGGVWALPWFCLGLSSGAAVFAMLWGMAAVLVVLAATLRALSDGRGVFAAMAAFVAVVGAFFSLWLGMGLSSALRGDGVPGAVFFAVFGGVLAVALAGWVFVAGRRKPAPAFCLACGAAALAPAVFAVWGWSYGREKRPPLPEAALSARIVEPAKLPGAARPGELVLWRNVAVSGLSPRQILVPCRVDGEWRSTLRE
jgi:hypothetical protein